MAVIEVKNLTKDYGFGRGVFDVSFSVPQGLTGKEFLKIMQDMQKVHNDQRLKVLLDLLKLDENQLSCVCLAILDNAKIGLTYGELILLNVGAFATLFAMNGVSLLASC